MTLKEYIKGKRKGKEANSFEREAMNDPFLQDAIDGFDSVEGDHIRLIEELQKKIGKKSREKSGEKNKSRRFYFYGIAASVTLLLGVGGLFFLNRYSLSPPDDVKVYSQGVVDTIQEDVLVINEEELLSVNTQPDRPKDEEKRRTNREVVSPPVLEIMADAEEEPSLSYDENSIVVSPLAAPLAAESEKEIAVSEIGAVHEHIERGNSDVALEKVYAKNKSTAAGKIKVLDERGEPLVGVVVRVKGTNNAKITDWDGEVELDAPLKENEVLVAEYVGYDQKEFSSSENIKIIQMEPSTLALNEVVVVGYTTQKKQSLTESVQQMEAVKKAPFGKKEFKKYVEQNRREVVCEEKKPMVQLKFYIDATGEPVDIKVEKSNCMELETEIIRLLNNSPEWTKTNRNIKMTFYF